MVNQEKTVDSYRRVDSYLLASPLAKEYDANTYHTIRSLLVYELAEFSQGNPLERIAKFGGIDKSDLIDKNKQHSHLMGLRMATVHLIDKLVEENEKLLSTNSHSISINKIGSMFGGRDRSTIYNWYDVFQSERDKNYSLVKQILNAPCQESKPKMENIPKYYWDDLNDVLIWMEEIAKRNDFTINTCLDLVSEYTEIPLKIILGKNRSRYLVYIRAGATYLFREKLRLSLPAIGNYMTKDHTTILNQERMVKEILTKGTLLYL